MRHHNMAIEPAVRMARNLARQDNVPFWIHEEFSTSVKGDLTYGCAEIDLWQISGKHIQENVLAVVMPDGTLTRINRERMDDFYCQYKLDVARDDREIQEVMRQKADDFLKQEEVMDVRNT